MYTNVFAIGVLIAIISCLTDVSCRERCLGVHNYCSGQFGDMKAICKDGYCYCTGQDYDYNTCLPDAYGCKIVKNADTALGKPQYNNQQPQTIYSCTPGSSSTQYEVHVLSVYEVINRRPPKAGDATINIVSQGSPNRPIILVLGSYEPVNWILKLPAGITISKVILVAYYIDESAVSGDLNQVQVVERKGTRNSQWGRGYGSDSGGGDTVGLLKQVHSSFGVVTSFTGTYKADEWSLVLSSAHGSGPGIIGSSVSASTTATATVVYTPKPTPNTPTIHRQKCYSNYCPGGYKMNAVCRDGYCVCTGQGYNYETCLPDAYGCKIIMNADTALAKPRYNNQLPNTIYSCTPDSSSTQYEVHVISVYEGSSHTRPPTAGDTQVNIVGRGKSNRPIILVFGSYEPVNWILNLPAGITISKVILVAYYTDKCSVSGDVNQVQAVERKGTPGSHWDAGFGSDSGGGDTVGMLKQVYNRFGVVTSFTGTYKADEWSLVLSSPHGPGFGNISSSAAVTTTNPTPTYTATPTPSPTYTTTPTHTAAPNLHRQKCYIFLNSSYCSGQYGKMKAICKDGYCVCTGQDYNYFTCLPDAYGCKIVMNDDKALAKPWYNNQQRQTIYSCTPDSSSPQYEVHVLSVYEVINRRPPTAGDATVNIISQGRSDRPIVLVLGSYEPVNWILNLPANIAISKVILVAYYVDESSVSGVEQQVVERKTYQFGWGFGSDSGGGDTVALLKQVHNRFGVVTSFTGTYKANKWTLELSSLHGPGSGIVGSSVAASNRATAVSTPTPTPTIHRQKCYSNYCPGGFKMNAVCRDGYCVCTGQGYNYETCLPDAYGCKIVLDADTALAKPRYNSQQRQSIYSCTPNSSSTQYEVHVLSVYEVINRRPPKAGDAIVNIISQGSSDRPIILVLGSYEPVNWILNLQPGIKISKVILVAYYLDESSVRGDLDQVQAVERKSTLSSQWDSGYGSDSGGGGTVEMLKQVYNRFGVVTSFTGTYKADEWSLVLSSPQEQSSSPCQNYTCLSKAIQKLSKMVKQLREDVETQDERITALELEKNQGSQYQAIAQYSSGVSAYKSLETLLGVFVTTIIITISHYVW